MIKFKTHFSSSKGNMHICKDKKTKIIIDFGVTYKKAQKALNYKLRDISGICACHSHRDHCKGIPEAIKKSMDCYLLPETIESLGVSGHRVHEIEPSKLFKIGSLKILPFSLEHDVPNVGFLVESDFGGKLVYITDTAYCKYKFKGVDVFAIEANYSRAILDKNLESGLIPHVVEKRVSESHFEIQNVKEFFMNQDLSKCKKSYLIHLSDANADPKLFEDEIKRVTGKPCFAWRD